MLGKRLDYQVEENKIHFFFEKELDHFVSATGFTLRAGNTRRKNNGNC